MRLREVDTDAGKPAVLKQIPQLGFKANHRVFIDHQRRVVDVKAGEHGLALGGVDLSLGVVPVGMTVITGDFGLGAGEGICCEQRGGENGGQNSF